MSGHLFEDKIDLSNLISAMGVKSSEYADIIRIKAELFSLNKQMNEFFISLGKSVYKMSRKGNLNQQKINEKCERITELYKTIKNKEDEIEHVHEAAQKILSRKAGGKSKHKHKSENEYIIESNEYEIEPLD